MEKYVFKIETQENWQNAQSIGVYTGSKLDKKDGFIHLSTISQAQQTLDLYFQNVENLIIAKINIEEFEGILKWEESRNGDLFPHIYGELNMKYVDKTFDIKYENGKPFLPNDLI